MASPRLSYPLTGQHTLEYDDDDDDDDGGGDDGGLMWGNPEGQGRRRKRKWMIGGRIGTEEFNMILRE